MITTKLRRNNWCLCTSSSSSSSAKHNQIYRRSAPTHASHLFHVLYTLTFRLSAGIVKNFHQINRNRGRLQSALSRDETAAKTAISRKQDFTSFISFSILLTNFLWFLSVDRPFVFPSPVFVLSIDLTFLVTSFGFIVP